MQYLKAEDGVVVQYPYALRQLKQDNPNVSFPSELSDETLATWGVFPVTIGSVPVYDNMTQFIQQDAPKQIDGVWSVDWVIQQLSQETAASNIREQRNALLAECDWTQLADATVNSLAWANYRQSLRDITLQVGFPYQVSWPTKPE